MMGDNPIWADTALLIIDMINPLSFEGADRIINEVDAAAEVILRLRTRADAAGAPVVYVNDNFGCWSDDRREIIARATAAPAPGPGSSGRDRSHPNRLSPTGGISALAMFDSIAGSFHAGR